ncbi:MAG: xanthine dehydrogenase family protein molybdopterin-binding subunit [Proteobacteria bacterium]|nr:xanthine dehydrogenase family protein molybdopterin-binding subunit [Pseudomonadota bacterium]
MTTIEGAGVLADKFKYIGTRPVRPDGVEKVTGRARYGADITLPGMLHGRVLRSPHAHAWLRSIDTSKARALPGVKAVVTRDDFADQPSEIVPAGELVVNYRDVVRNIMAREKVLYDGHAVAAVAATSASVARRALALIEVTYEVLPHVIDVLEAARPDAPLLHDFVFTEGVEPKPESPSNVAKRVVLTRGDVAAGFAEADVVVEREYDTKPVHQGYIEPQACLAHYVRGGQSEIWTTTQGHYLKRAFTARLCGLDIGHLKVTPTEIGGGFGGKNNVYLEPVALELSRQSGRPVKMAMSRGEVLRATGPASGSHMRVKIGAMRDGRITAGEAEIYYQAGAFPGSPIGPATMTTFACYDVEAVNVIAYDVVSNRPKVAAYRAPGAQIIGFAVESTIDLVAREIGMDPIDFRLRNAAKEGTKAAYGPTFGPVGLVECLEAVRDHPNYRAELGPNQGRGVAAGFWFNIGGDTCVTMNVNDDGSVALMVGNPDIGGSRASMMLMAAEALEVDPKTIIPTIGDTNAIGFNFLTAGSRTTFAVGKATVGAARKVVAELKRRAALTWDIPVEAVEWADGYARPAGANAGEFEPLSIADIAKNAGKTGGPISGHVEENVKGAGPSFAAEMVDLEVDPETGKTTILRFTVAQDAGKAIHPAYVEGQYQGAAAQGIGWALNEEYIYDANGRLENPNFLDYRIPLASDLPMIDTVIVEVPNPNHPYGVRGIGETSIIPVMAAVANAIADAVGVRMTALPMSPPKMLKAIDEAAGG